MSHRLTFAVLLLVSTSVGVFAQDMPRQLTGELIRTERENCKTSTAYDMKFTNHVDVDGDGRKDVVLDYSEASCGAEPEPYCNDQGCLLKVFLNTGGGWRKSFEGRVKSWSVDTSSGRASLLVDGHPAGK
ncbi:MAG: hypothetical protein ABTQ29_12075 [Siculibacillus sp.]